MCYPVRIRIDLVIGGAEMRLGVDDLTRLELFAREDVRQNERRICSRSDHNNPKVDDDSRLAHRRIMHQVFEALVGTADGFSSRVGSSR